jgi:hypothetical protein
MGIWTGRACRRALLLAVLAGCVQIAVRAAQVDEYEVKALFLVSFLKFATWPAAEPADAPLVIGVIGEDPFGDALDRAARRGTVGTRPLVVRRVKHAGQIGEPHLLFIAASEQRELPAILRQLDGKPVLTVGDTPGFAQSGVALNFYKAGDRLAFETNTGAVSRARIHLSAHLLKLARVVG